MARRRNPQPKCYLCNHFMSWSDVRRKAVCWTPFGGPLDVDPPEPEYAHTKCWCKADERQLTHIRASWIPPYFRGHAA